MWKDSPLSMKQLNRNSSTATATLLPAADSSSTGGRDEATPSDSQVDSGNQESSGEAVQAEFSAPQEKLASGGGSRSGQSGETPLETPSPSDAEAGGPTADRPSTILKALSGFLPHNLRSHLDEDPMADPEHIFRESSMVVRTDEPTSIIALALKYVKIKSIYPVL